MMKSIFYTVALVAIHFTMSLPAHATPAICSGTVHESENVLKTGLRILDKTMVNKT